MPRKNKSINNQPSSSNITSCVKRQFKNESEARRAADYQMLENMQLELSVYKCELCSHWHLTRSLENKHI